MITRQLITYEIEQLQDHYLGFLHRIILALSPVKSRSSTSAQEESWADFVQSNYGIFRDDPLERGPQGTLEIREALG